MLITYLEQFCVFFLGYGLLVPLLLDSRGEGIPHEVHKSIYEELNVRLFPITKLGEERMEFNHRADFVGFGTFEIFDEKNAMRISHTNCAWIVKDGIINRAEFHINMMGMHEFFKRNLVPSSNTARRVPTSIDLKAFLVPDFHKGIRA